jgi:thioredoxin
MPTTTVPKPPLDVTDEDFEKIVLNSEIPTLVDFWAPWCGYCRKLAPVFAEAAAKWAGRLLLVKVNVDTERELAKRFGIMSLPTLKWFCGGREAGESVGAMPAAELEELLARMETHAEECIQNSSPMKGD